MRRISLVEPAERAMHARRPLSQVAFSLAALALSTAACGPADVPADGGPTGGAVAEAPLPPGSVFQGPAFEFEEVVPDVYHVRGTGALSIGSNGAVIINEDDVLVVDSHISPAAARALLQDLKSITDKPVRYVVNTHYHFDHAHGNQIYPDDVHVIGHEDTREMLLNGGSLGRSYELFVGTLPEQIEMVEARIAAMDSVPPAADADGPSRADLETRLAYLRTYHDGQEGLVPTGPNTTLSERMTLFRGDREIRLLFFGRGHTGGDVVVHLPAERILISGDLITGGIPYMGDGYLDEWDETLEHLKALDFDWILPGHGRPFQERERIDHLQAYLRDLSAQAAAMHARGVSYQDAAATIDLRSHVDHFPALTEIGAPELAVRRLFELLEGTGR